MTGVIEQDGAGAQQTISGDDPEQIFEGTEIGGATISHGEHQGKYVIRDNTGSVTWEGRPFCTLSLLSEPIRGIDATTSGKVAESNFHFSIPEALENASEYIFVEGSRTWTGDMSNFGDEEVRIEVWDVAANEIAGPPAREPEYMLDGRYNPFSHSENYVRSNSMKDFLDANTEYKIVLNNTRVQDNDATSTTYDWFGARMVFL